MQADQPAPAAAHDHVFGLDQPMPGESRTLVVTVVTGVMMVIEVAAGLVFGSMALLADGLHMASHAAALAIAYVAYVYARRRAGDERFSFGTGKVNSLAGFTGAILLAVFAGIMGWESVARFLHPVVIQFDQAILVAVIGLLVNAASAVILAHPHQHQAEAQPSGAGDVPDAAPEATQAAHAGHDHYWRTHDHNLRSAYLHVLADALTSVLAIVALLGGKYGRANWLDPLMGIVGAVLVARWSFGLIRASGAVLLDRQGPADLCERVRGAIERAGDAQIIDLHIWAIGPRRYAAIVHIGAAAALPPHEYKARLAAAGLGFDHVTIEVSRVANPPHG